MRKTGIVIDGRCLDHLTDSSHPENPKRLESISAMLSKIRIGDRLTEIKPRMALPEEILRIHTSEYLDQIADTTGCERVAITPDTLASAGSFEAAMTAAGGLFEAISAVMTGAVSNAFALVRPPGHHAEKSRALGFCLFNNAALGAMYAMDRHRVNRILLVDWDVHHGNGTQHLFEDTDRVLFFSTHQFPHFPGTGAFIETGRGRGEGYTVNVVLQKGCGDGEYAAVYRDLLPPLAEAYRPELILVSAGFDTHRMDPMGGMQMTESGFAGLTRCLMDLADRHCGGRLVLVLEGGYHLASLASSVEAVLTELADVTHTDIDRLAGKADPKKVAYAVSRCRHVHHRFWKTLGEA